MKKNKIWILVSVIVACGIYRLLPHISNVTPIGAMALTGGMYFRKRILGFIIPIVTLYASDLVLNNTLYAVEGAGFVWFSKYMITVYIAFLITVLLGIFLNKKTTSAKIVGGTLVASLLFFLITNLGTWAEGLMYPMTLSGMGAALLAGVPFFRSTLLGNLIFIPLFVAFFEYYMNGNNIFSSDKEVALDRA